MCVAASDCGVIQCLSFGYNPLAMRARPLHLTLIMFVALSGCAGHSAPWYGRGCNCSAGQASRPPLARIDGLCDASCNDFHNVITEGDNVVVIDFVHVYDNAEGKKPDGSGTNWGWMGPIPWKHGPVGNLHIRIYGDDARELRHIRNLPGPERTLPRFEWNDNQCMAYLNFGIWDWDWSADTSITVRIYESDPGPWRDHDTLIRAKVSRSVQAQVDSTYFIPRIEFRTTALPESIASVSEN